MGQQTINIIEPIDILRETMLLKNDKYRLVAITCTYKDCAELIYSFDKNYDLVNLKFYVEDNFEVDSISCVYPYAFLYENEIKELFGVKIINISLDFNDKLYKIAVETPFKTKEEINNGK